MYFWKIHELKKLIVEQGLSESQVFYYILLYVGLSVIGVEVTGYFPYEDPNGWDYFQSGFNILIAIAGTVAAFLVNGGAQGKAFAAKYFSISFVVLIRFLVYLIPFLAVYIVYYGMTIDVASLENEETLQTGWFEVMLFAVWITALYGSVVKHIRDTATS